MRKLTMKPLFTTLMLYIMGCLSAQAFAGNFSCGQSGSGTPYCQYIGNVKQTYVNDDGKILIYFDGSFSLSDITTAGISSVSTTTAAMYPIASNPDFARMLYSTALTAQSSGKNVTIQFNTSTQGYLRIKKIWLQ